MGDLPVQQCEFDWQIKPPETVKIGHTLTVVVRIPGRVQMHVLEAFLLDESGEIGERIGGEGMHTGPGFNGDETEGTYVWFFIKIEKRGNIKIKIRSTWRKGREMFGAVDTFEVAAGDNNPSHFYSPEELNLLSLLLDW
ncbi:hypothetical protein F4678DRAFT_478820 [Xylaria arbuscula]|nr:hypothetical protein F4678DRAFT_478820 [Xylaria arbuscula]